MKIFTIFFIAIMVWSSVNSLSASAQTKSAKHEQKGESKFIFGLGSRFYFNQRDVYNDDIYPTAISTNKPYSLNFQQSITYQRQTKYGLIYGLGIETGNRSYSLSINYESMEFIDNPKQVIYVDYLKDYPFKTRFWGLKIFTGYSHSLKVLGAPEWNIELTGGISITTQTRSFVEEVTRVPLAYYITDNNTSVNVMTNRMIRWGRAGENAGGPMVGEIYLGISRKLSNKYIKDINFGLTFTHIVTYPRKNIEGVRSPGLTDITTYYLYDLDRLGNKIVSNDSYNPSEMSVGLKCAMGFYWK